MPQARYHLKSRTGVQITLRPRDDPHFAPCWLGFEAGRQGWRKAGWGGAFSPGDRWTDEELTAWDEGYEEGRKLNPER